MLHLRPLLNAFLGLLLLVQAIGVASANASVSQWTDAAAIMDMPCHGLGSGMPDKPSCCDAKCPSMVACALGHFGLPSTPVVAIGPATPPRLAPRVSARPAAPPQSLLRPPISSLRV